MYILSEDLKFKIESIPFEGVVTDLAAVKIDKIVDFNVVTEFYIRSNFFHNS